jgi:hypothetical protein
METKKVYQITVGSNTANGKFIESARVFISTDSEISDVRKVYTAKYSPLVVVVSEVLCVTLDAKNLQVEEPKKAQESKIVLNEATRYSPAQYSAEVRHEDIVHSQQCLEDIKDARRAVEKATKAYQETIMSQFNLKSISGFQVNFDHVTFNFYPTGFNFNKK